MVIQVFSSLEFMTNSMIISKSKFSLDSKSFKIIFQFRFQCVQQHYWSELPQLRELHSIRLSDVLRVGMSYSFSVAILVHGAVQIKGSKVEMRIFNDTKT